MAEALKPDSLPQGAQPQAPKPPPKQNPVFRMMGLPNLPKKLPSRNWMIFLTVTGSFIGAKLYDTRQKKAVQKKWCDLVSHIAQQPLPVNQMPRKLTIYLSAPPGDGIRSSREYFKEYIKPVLVAASMDYDVIEGRKEGDVRYGTAEQIRRLRRKKGETSASEKEPDVEQAIDMIRDKMHIQPEPGLRGDLVIGRHTWKEYIRGIHEGWLGPVDAPPPEPEPSPIHPPTEARTDDPSATTPPPPAEDKKAEEEKKEKKPPYPPPAYLPISAYSASPVSPHIPAVLEPSAPIRQRHLLGFLKTPQRIYDFLNRRILAEEIGRETAAIVLGAHRPYQQSAEFASTSTSDLDNPSPVATRAPESDVSTAVVQTSETWEQQAVLVPEEAYWHKSIYKPRKDDHNTERVWLNDVVLDSKIAERMRKFELAHDEQERAERIGSGAEKTRAVSVHDLRSEKVVVGNVDDEI